MTSFPSFGPYTEIRSWGWKCFGSNYISLPFQCLTPVIVYVFIDNFKDNGSYAFTRLMQTFTMLAQSSGTLRCSLFLLWLVHPCSCLLTPWNANVTEISGTCTNMKASIRITLLLFSSSFRFMLDTIRDTIRKKSLSLPFAFEEL